MMLLLFPSSFVERFILIYRNHDTHVCVCVCEFEQTYIDLRQTLLQGHTRHMLV